jgi:hypothetical protein
LEKSPAIADEDIRIEDLVHNQGSKKEMQVLVAHGGPWGNAPAAPWRIL